MTPIEIKAMAFDDITRTILLLEKYYHDRPSNNLKPEDWWTKKELSNMLYKIFDETNGVSYTVGETITGQQREMF
jgi:hypothetical protein|tara:strand:+ start:500 stop:724 length:225 start_codon:yes stop_codon:yes gene_type:complete